MSCHQAASIVAAEYFRSVVVSTQDAVTVDEFDVGVIRADSFGVAAIGPDRFARGIK